MANKKGVVSISGTVEEITERLKKVSDNLHIKIDPNERDYQITGAKIKDMLCNYDYIITGEKNTGETGSIKGPGIVDDDLLNAIARLNVHAACLDGAFRTAHIEIGSESEFKNIDDLRNHELTANYIVTGINIRGGEGNESVILIGTKYLAQASDHMEFKMPKILIGNGSGYTWYNELSDCVELVREEVALYREGKYTEKEPKEAKQLPNQKELFEQGKLEGDELDAFLAEQETTGNQSNENLGE